MDSVTTRHFSAPGGEATVWLVAGGKSGFARVDRLTHCVSTTWSTEWAVPDVRSLVKAHAIPKGRRSHDSGLGLALRVPAEVDALVVDDMGKSVELSSCAELLEVLRSAARAATLVRIEITEGTLVWSRDGDTHDWHGATMGVITDHEGPSYTNRLIALSATNGIRQLSETIAATSF